jgi:uncharacterized protein (DUF427 family)
VTPALAHLFTDSQGFGWLSEDDFVGHFAADVDPVKAKVMHAVQQPLATSAFGDVMGIPAWKTLPSWYLVATDDEALPPDAERLFAARMGATTIEIPSSHVAMVSHPGDVAQLIETAAGAVLAGKDIKVPDADHPISIEADTVRVVARVADTVVADTSTALTMREASYPPVQYIPLDDVVPGVLRPSASGSYCPYKGDASYYDVVLPDGEELTDAVWTYRAPYQAVHAIAGRVAFYTDRVQVEVETR